MTMQPRFNQARSLVRAVIRTIQRHTPGGWGFPRWPKWESLAGLAKDNRNSRLTYHLMPVVVIAHSNRRRRGVGSRLEQHARVLHKSDWDAAVTGSYDPNH